MLSKILIKFIKYYQSKGGGSEVFFVDCNFKPTCSEYAILCLQKYSLFYALKLILVRLRKCNKRDFTEICNDDFK